MLPSEPPFPHAYTANGMRRDEQQGLEEQWRAMMFTIDGSGSHDNDGTYSTSREHQQEERQPISDFPRRYHKEPEGDRFVETNNTHYKEHSNQHQNKKMSYPSQHLRMPEQSMPQQSMPQMTRSGSPTQRSRLNESNKTAVYLDGVIPVQSLSELSNTETVPKSIMETAKNGWSIHDSHRRSQERENRRLVEASNSRHRRNEHGYDQWGRSAQNHYESPSRPNHKMATHDRNRLRYASDQREKPPPVSRFEAYYSDQDRSGQNAFDVVPPGSDQRNYSQRSRSWSLDRSLLDDQLSPESAVSPEKRMFSKKSAHTEFESLTQPRPPARTPESTPDYGQDRYEAAGPRSSQKKKSILKEQNSPPPYISPTHFVPSNNGPGNRHDSLERVVDLFDTSMRMHANRKTERNSTGAAHRSGSERYATNDNSYYGHRSEHSQRSYYAHETRQTVGNSLQPTELFSNTNTKIPKTDAQKRHELEILRGMYKDSRDSRHMSFDQWRGSKKSTSDLDEPPTGRPQASVTDLETVDFSIHAAIWGSDSDDSNKRNSNVQSRATRYPTEDFDRERANAERALAERANAERAIAERAMMERAVAENSRIVASPKFATDIGALAKSVMEGSGSLNLGNKAGVEDLMNQLASCNGLKQGSPPKHSKLFVRTGEQEGTDTSPEENNESSLGMFEEIRRQLLSRTGMDSSGFQRGELDHNQDAEEEQRIQEKLDAVKARSIRNAEMFEKMHSEKTQRSEGEETNQISLFSVEGNGDQVESVLTVSASEFSEEQSIVRHLVDIAPMESEERKNEISNSCAATEVTGLVTEATVATHEAEASHNMYVAYSEFSQDARKVIKLCGHRAMPVPNRKKGEVLVRVHASTVSASDCAIRRGEWSKVPMDPYIVPGTALVGRVVESEPKKLRTSFSSSTIEAGDVVLSLSVSGANTRFTCVSKTNLIKVPPHLNPEQVVCLAETYLTAFQSLHLGQKGGIRYREDSLKGKSILIMGGYSPFGRAIIELCRAAGAACCYALTSDDSISENGRGLDSSLSSRNLGRQYEALEQWGAIPLSNNPQDWLTLIGRQIDIFVTTHDNNEDVQGNNSISADHWKVLKKEGQVHVVFSNPGLDEDDQRRMVFESSSSKKSEVKSFRIPSCRLGGREKLADRAMYYNLFDTWYGDRSSKAMARKDLEHLVQLLEIELLDPEIARRFPLSKIAKAQHCLERKTIPGDGHLICSPWLIEKTTDEQLKDIEPEEHVRGILI